MGFFVDSYYWLLVLPAMAVALYAQFKVKSVFNKYSGVPARMTGEQASRMIQAQNGLQVNMGAMEGSMTDNYDPRDNTIRLSQTVGPMATVAAVGVAAHETGHALQYANHYFPIRIRTAILPVTKFGSAAAPWLFIAGLLLGIGPLAYLGLICFGAAVFFQLVTLPVEFNASFRALAILRNGNVLTREELSGVKKVLTAAALTYVASALTALMSFLRLILLAQSRKR